MNECDKEQFNRLLVQLQNDKASGLTGPFIHSAPEGNMFRGPFREQAWMIGKKTVLKKAWTPETGWKHYRAADGDEE